MLTFVMLGKHTQFALEQLKGCAERDQKAVEIIKQHGGHLISLYYTFGQYDFIAIIEAPTEDDMAEILLEMGRFGTICSETLLALKPEKLYRAASEII